MGFPSDYSYPLLTVRRTPEIAIDVAFFGFYFLTQKHNKLLFRRNINKCEKNIKRTMYKRVRRAVSTNNLRGKKTILISFRVFKNKIHS